MTNTQNTLPADTVDIRPFRVEFPQSDLDDLNARLALARFATPAPGDDWVYGVPVAFLRDYVNYWLHEFDWKAQQDRINSFPQFLIEIDGQTIHFVHVPSAEPNATPLLLAHTYPGSYVEFLDMVDLLTNPVAHGGRAEDAFSVVIPSTPGFGFSTPLAAEGWTMKRTALAFDTLMRRLGYSSYGVHGSDGGAMIARELGLLNPNGFLGGHVLQLFSFPSGDPAEFENLTPKNYADLEFMQLFQSRAGFSAMMAARPQTIGAALADSPVAQLAWNELFFNFGDPHLLTKDQVLTQVTLYWLTNTGGSAARMYFAEARAEAAPAVNTTPVGVAVFADDFQTIRAFAERDNSNIVHWNEFPTGGHFAAMEVPEVVTGDIRDFFAALGAA